MTTLTRILLRRGAAADWVSANPTLLAGEMGLETDTRRFKFGDGATTWNALAYSAAGAPVWGGIVGTLTDQTDLSAALADKASKAYADSLVVGLLDDRGNFDASLNTFPAAGGSGAAGVVLKGDLWTVSVAGTLGGHPVTAGDAVRALVDAPGNIDANWAITENNIGYVPLADTGAAVATRLHAATAKTVLVDGDEVAGTDSANGFGLIRTLWSDAWTYIKGKADVFYVLRGLVTASALTMNTGKLLGRSTVAIGGIEEIALGTNLTLVAGVLNATGGSSGATLGANTFTGAQEVDLAVGAASTDGVVLATTQLATGTAAQKWSPATRWKSSAWNSNLSVAQPVDFVAEVQPSNPGGFTPAASWTLSSRINNGAWSPRVAIEGNTLYKIVLLAQGFGVTGTDGSYILSSAQTGDGGGVLIPFGGIYGFTGSSTAPPTTHALMALSRSADGSGLAIGSGASGATDRDLLLRNLTSSGVVKVGVFTVATLPSASTSGNSARAHVSDASTTLTAGIGTIVTGGGANKVPVYSDGTNWLYG